ncbi:MAG TPA: hypothetical protein VG269_19570 [Tepidisphaeraceae bacterium]|jgi:hypothetical protein|nr:hypothetical protein [Tepidisphaeraceae bacterium]
MATSDTVTVPHDLFHQIEERARAAGTTVDAQTTELLTRALAEEMRERNLVNEVRKERGALASRGVYLTDDSIRQAIQWRGTQVQSQ